MQLNIKYSFIIALFGLLGIIVSCNNDDDTKSSEVKLESFGPSGVKHGETIKFIGQNLDKVTSIVLAPGVEIASGSFASQTSSMIEVVIPQEAEAGKITLKTPAGDIESKTPLSFEVPVTITSITAEARPGENITITGDKVNWIEAIVFEDNILVTDFVSKSLTELVVTVPASAQTGFLVFKSGGTKPLTFASENELVVTLPAITSITPSAVRHTGTITITGTDLDLVTAIKFAGDQTVALFESQSATEIVVTVPEGVVDGKITLIQASPVNVESADDLHIILPVGTLVAPSPAKPGIDAITITGTDLDLVSELSFPNVAEPVSADAFTSQTATEIVVAVPEGTKSGPLMYKTIHNATGGLGVNVIVPGAGPPPLAITLYDDEIFFGGGIWSWGGASDAASAEQFYSGDLSWKHTTDGADGGASVGGMTGVDASGQAVFKFSLYGGPGTDGKQVAAILGSDGADKWDSYNTVTIHEGVWTEYSIPLTQYPTVNLSNVTRWIFKPEGTNNATFYVDRVGFDAAGPDPLDYYIFDDALENGWSQWDGWSLESKDFASTDEVFKGDKSIRATYNGQWGAVQIGAPSADAFSGYTTFSFRVYVSAAQDLIIQLNNDADHNVSLVEGWNLVEVPIADLAGSGSLVELRFKNPNANVPVTLYFDEIGLKE